MRHNIFAALKVSALALVLSLGLSYVYAWTAPTVTPPGGNVAAPLNVSSVNQVKIGGLTMDVATSTVFKDANDPAFFLNPNGDSVVKNIIATGDITGANRAAMTAVTTGVYDDVTLNSPYSRINADSFHTNGLGVGQIFIEGNAIDANSAISIGKGLAGGQVAQTVNVGTLNATGFNLSTGAAAGKVLTSDASGNAAWQNATGSTAPVGGTGGDVPEEAFYTVGGNYTFVVQPWMHSVSVELVGAGGGGGAAINTLFGAQAGTAGGDSSFGPNGGTPLISAGGGGGGAVSTGGVGADGVGSGGAINNFFYPIPGKGVGGAGGVRSYSCTVAGKLTTCYQYGSNGGAGGYSRGTLSVTPGDTLSLKVGIRGTGGCANNGLGFISFCGSAGTGGFAHLSFMPAPVLGNSAVFTADGTFTVPAGVTFISVETWGGGGAGGNGGVGQNYTGYYTYTAGGGGGSGGYAKSLISVTPGATYTVVVGKGGTGYIAGWCVNGGQSCRNNEQGNIGGSSSFGGTLVSAPGGKGGVNFDSYCGGGGCNGDISCNTGWQAPGGTPTAGNFLNVTGNSGLKCGIRTGGVAVVKNGRGYGAGGLGGASGATAGGASGASGGVVVSW